MRNFLLLSTMVVMPVTALAADNEVYTDTHTYTPIELTSISQIEKAYKTASVCFLGTEDCGSIGFGKGDEDMNIDTANQCKNEGFTITSCALPSYPEVRCPYNDKYFAKCVPDKPRACKESGYSVFSCTAGEVIDSSCPYDSTYKKCKCNPCAGYDYTLAQATAEGYVADGSCQSCATTKYKRKENPCSGYSTCTCGGASGASVCYSGSVQKFNSCKPCCNEACPSGTTEANPGGCGGSTLNGCRNKNCYYPYVKCCTPSCYYPDCQEGQSYIWNSSGGSDGCGGVCPQCAWKIIGNYVYCSAIYEKPGSWGSTNYCYIYQNKSILYNGSIVDGAGSQNERCRNAYSYAVSDRESVECGTSRYY